MRLFALGPAFAAALLLLSGQGARAAAYAGTDASLDEGSEACVKVLDKAEQRMDASDPLLQKCSEKGESRVCGKARDKLESSASNSSRQHKGKKLIPSCKGDTQVAEIRCIGGYVAYNGNCEPCRSAANGNPNTNMAVRGMCK